MAILYCQSNPSAGRLLLACVLDTQTGFLGNTISKRTPVTTLQCFKQMTENKTPFSVNECGCLTSVMFVEGSLNPIVTGVLFQLSLRFPGLCDLCQMIQNMTHRDEGRVCRAHSVSGIRNCQGQEMNDQRFYCGVKHSYMRVGDGQRDCCANSRFHVTLHCYLTR